LLTAFQMRILADSLVEVFFLLGLRGQPLGQTLKSRASIQMSELWALSPDLGVVFLRLMLPALIR